MYLKNLQKRCNDPESKILSPLLNRNKERVTKGNSNVTFSDECVFNQKTEKKTYVGNNSKQ